MCPNENLMGSQKPFKILPARRIEVNRTGTQGASISVGKNKQTNQKKTQKNKDAKVNRN